MNLKSVVITVIIVLVSLSLSWAITIAVHGSMASANVIQEKAIGGMFYLDGETIEQIQNCPDCSVLIDWDATEK